MQTSPVKSLSPSELSAWRGFLRSHAALVRELDRELEQAHGMPLTQYEVLLMLENADCGRLRMNDLAESVLLSQSGLTRVVDRLERQELVVRERCDSDRRGLNARITDAGRERLAEARCTHLAGVRARFVELFDEAELEQLASAWERVSPGSTGACSAGD